MNKQENLDLKRLIDETQCGNNTENIRKLKHSVLIRNDIRTMENLKKTNSDLRKSNPDKFAEVCQQECNFLFNNYTDIFNKVLKDELDLLIMTKLLTVLKLIEDGKVDQHEGSVMVGKILKELYVDSALKRADNINKEYENEKVEPNSGKKMSWRDFKQLNA
jgi:hypothetical protein